MKNSDLNKAEIAKRVKFSKVTIDGAELIARQYNDLEKAIEEIEFEVQKEHIQTTEDIAKLEKKVEKVRSDCDAERIIKMENRILAHKIMLMKKSWDGKEDEVENYYLNK